MFKMLKEFYIKRFKAL